MHEDEGELPPPWRSGWLWAGTWATALDIACATHDGVPSTEEEDLGMRGWIPQPIVRLWEQ